MATTQQTKPSTQRLSDVARHVVMPTGIVTTGWPRVEQQLGEMGIRFKPWQEGIGRVALGKRADNLYACTIGGVTLSIPRQVGKTFLVGALVMALCIIFPGMTVLWTAHRTRTTTRTFQSLQRLAKRKKIAPHIYAVRMTNGEQEITFRNGSAILFGARETGFGRGFDEVDVEVFDEAQILTEKALEDMIAATNQSRHEHGALLFFMGTPPKPSDPGEAFGVRRDKALAGKSPDGFYVEFSADRGADPDDRAQWAKANPSYPEMTPLESMLRLRENLPSDDAWLREALGIWDEAEVKGGAVDPDLWMSLKDVLAKRGAGQVFAVATDQDREWCAIAVAWRRSDGLRQVMLADYRPGTAWVAERVAELRRRWGGKVVADTPSRGLVADAEEPATPAQAQAHNALSDAVLAGTVRHGNQPALNTAVRGAKWKPYGDTRVLDRKGSLDISPLLAAALAVQAIGTTGASAYEDEGIFVV